MPPFYADKTWIFQLADPPANFSTKIRFPLPSSFKNYIIG